MLEFYATLSHVSYLTVVPDIAHLFEVWLGS